MNSSKHGKQRSGWDVPYCIEYWRGDRMLRDSGKTLDDAKRRIEQRLAKRHNRGERAVVRYKNEIVFET